MNESFPAQPNHEQQPDEWQPTDEQRREYEWYLDSFGLPDLTPEDFGYDPENMTEEQQETVEGYNRLMRRRVFLPRNHMSIEELFGVPARQSRRENDQTPPDGSKID